MQASEAPFCSREARLTPAQQDRLLRFGAAIKAELDASGRVLAIVSRSGTNLDRFGVRYTHSGIALKHSPNTPWSVRQLYYACDEGQPRLYDQGMSGFVLGDTEADQGHAALLLLPPAQEQALERTALDNALALRLLGGRYSANAYPYDTRYQNCNQWTAELLATAWGWPADARPAERPRDEAQRWLIEQAYQPTAFEAGNPLMLMFSTWVPLLHSDDHPPEQLARFRYLVSMPASVEELVQRTVPGTHRVALCHNRQHIVVRRDGPPLSDGCDAAPGDTVLPFD